MMTNAELTYDNESQGSVDYFCLVSYSHVVGRRQVEGCSTPYSRAQVDASSLVVLHTACRQ